LVIGEPQADQTTDETSKENEQERRLCASAQPEEVFVLSADAGHGLDVGAATRIKKK
jgi:hypothetical protein